MCRLLHLKIISLKNPLQIGLCNKAARVTKALNEGYSLYGSPTMTFNGSEVIVGQVVVKDVEDESEVPQGLKDALAQQ